MSNGYLIPENAQPADTRCLRVFVPDDPLYIAAFLGALTYFGQWTAWERDEQKRGQFAAQAWREANELTIDGLSMPCSDNQITDDEMSEILDKLNDVISRLTEIEDMNITVTQTNSGCCCDGTDTGSTSQVSNMVIDPNDDGIIPPYDTDPVDVINITKCRAANYLARMVTETIRALAGRLGGGMLLILGIAEVLIAILSWIDLVPGDEVVGSVIGLLGLITIAQAIARMAGTTVFTWGVLDELAERLESPDIASGFVCALYNFNNASELGAALSSFLQSQVNQLDTDSFVKDAMIDVFDLLFDARIINWYVQNIGSIVPADFVAPYDCLCGATGDTCPTQSIVLAGLGNFPAGDLTGTAQGFASEFNSQTGYHEIIFELDANYCVTIENGAYTPNEAHEKCNDGVMVASDGSCIRRFVARSGDAFGTAVTFNSQSVDCACPIIPDDGRVQLVAAPFVSVTGVNTQSISSEITPDSMTASVIVYVEDGLWTKSAVVLYDASVIPAGWHIRGMVHKILESAHNEPIDQWRFADTWVQNPTDDGIILDDGASMIMGYTQYSDVPDMVGDIIAIVDHSIISDGTGTQGRVGITSERPDNGASTPRDGVLTFRSFFLISE